MIIEILSPATAKKDVKDKFELYEENGVKEYWIVAPDIGVVDIFELDKNGQYQLPGKFTKEDVVSVGIFPDLEIILEDVFSNDEEEINDNTIKEIRL